MEINLLDLLYKGTFLFAIFYGAIVITRFLSGKRKEKDTEDTEGEV